MTDQTDRCPTCGKSLVAIPDRAWDRCAMSYPMPTFEMLSGHTSPETAYVVDDYPYGFKLRCSIRYWVEYSSTHGYRFCSQTTNPKKPGTVWNKPKKSTYSQLCRLIRNPENDHIRPYALGLWPTECELRRFELLTGDTLTAEEREQIEHWRLMNAAQKHITYEVTTRSHGDTTPRQTDDDVRAVWGKALTIAAAERAAQG